MQEQKCAARRASNSPRSDAQMAPYFLMPFFGMWQQVGFLSDAFACFRKHGLAIDVVSTSEANVTVSLDPTANAVDKDTLRALVRDLSKICRAEILSPCATVSLVGKDIRTILHELAPVFAVFEERRVHLLSQAASDLNLTFVVDEEESDRLVSKLHALLFTSPNMSVRLELQLLKG